MYSFKGTKLLVFFFPLNIDYQNLMFQSALSFLLLKKEKEKKRCYFQKDKVVKYNFVKLKVANYENIKEISKERIIHL